MVTLALDSRTLQRLRPAAAALRQVGGDLEDPPLHAVVGAHGAPRGVSSGRRPARGGGGTLRCRKLRSRAALRVVSRLHPGTGAMRGNRSNSGAIDRFSTANLATALY